MFKKLLFATKLIKIQILVRGIVSKVNLKKKGEVCKKSFKYLQLPFLWNTYCYADISWANNIKKCGFLNLKTLWLQDEVIICFHLFCRIPELLLETIDTFILFNPLILILRSENQKIHKYFSIYITERYHLKKVKYISALYMECVKIMENFPSEEAIEV